ALAAALVPTLVLAGCGSSPAEKLDVAERDYSLTVDRPSLPGGRLDVDVANRGPSGHELLLFRTNLDDGALPLGADGRVDEDHGAGITKVVDSGSDVAAGKRRSLRATPAPGHY